MLINESYGISVRTVPSCKSYLKGSTLFCLHPCCFVIYLFLICIFDMYFCIYNNQQDNCNTTDEAPCCQVKRSCWQLGEDTWHSWVYSQTNTGIHRYRLLVMTCGQFDLSLCAHKGNVEYTLIHDSASKYMHIIQSRSILAFSLKH